jgi:hypothetical protein
VIIVQRDVTAFGAIADRRSRHAGRDQGGLHTRAVTVFRDPLSEGFRHFVSSMPAPVASGWSGCRVGLARMLQVGTTGATSGAGAATAHQYLIDPIPVGLSNQ